MPDPTMDRAAAILRRDGRIAMTTVALARALDGSAPILERRLRDDPRFVLLDPGTTLPGLDAWDARDRAAYAAAFQLVDLFRPPLVLLRDHSGGPEAPAAARLTGLLHRTVLDLAGTRPAPALALAAEGARAVLVRVIPPLDRTAPSTTLLPGPPPPG